MHIESSTLRRLTVDSLPTFNILHYTEGEAAPEDEGQELVEDKDDDHSDMDEHSHHNLHKYTSKKETLESFDFTDCESMMWRKHQYRRYYQAKGKFWTASRVSTFWKWVLTVTTGLVIAFTGAFVAVFTEVLTEWKLSTCYEMMAEGNGGGAFFAYQFISMFLVLCAGILCWREPAAAGSGIPEIKAFLNGVNLSNVVRMPVLVAKVIGMCFSCAAGLPLGKEGPMIHAGSIIGALMSQGATISFFGYDTSWTIFQDLRNDHTKRDFVTFGASAGIAAAFRAPIGGILFSLEEGASFWSTTITFRAFICAVITHLTLGLIFPDQSVSSSGMFAFGQFDNLYDGKSNFSIYEMPMFVAIGCCGGLLGALFNHVNERVSIYRKKKINAFKWKRMVELVSITLLMSFISFIFPLMWQVCQPLPDLDSYDPPATLQEIDLRDHLVSFQCKEGYYNQLASLYFTSGDMAMRQLFHFREVGRLGDDSFTTGPLILFFIPYFFMAAITAGVLAPAGLFVPTLLAGAAFGRMIGHWMNGIFPGSAADSGTYALIGAAAVLGGMARMTIAGTIIILEACGNITYLLPLMVTFAAARYTGNAINESMYDMQIHLKEMPFLEGTMHSLGMLNYHPISQIMAQPVITLREVEKVGKVMEILQTTNHNGFPIVNKDGRLRGLILRKTLCGLLKLKAYSTPAADNPKIHPGEGGTVKLDQAATVFYDTLERVYPNFPDVKAVRLNDKEMVSQSGLMSMIVMDG
jgi:chloride channel 7